MCGLARKPFFQFSSPGPWGIIVLDRLTFIEFGKSKHTKHNKRKGEKRYTPELQSFSHNSNCFHNGFFKNHTTECLEIPG